MMLKSYQPAGPLHLVRHGPKHVYDYIYIYKFSNLKKKTNYFVLLLQSVQV